MELIEPTYKTYTTILEEELNVLIMQKLFY